MEDHERMKDAALLRISNLNTMYGNSLILKGISMSVGHGEIVGVVGESGSGKSTVIYSAMGLLGKGGRVASGEIRYKTQDLLKISAEELRRLRGEKMTLIAQNPLDSFHPIRKIGKELRLFVKAHQTVSYPKAENEMLWLMEKFGLRDGREILGKYAFELSGGMCQRTAAALAMVRKPEVLFADEPTSALDVTVQKQVVEEMLRVREEAGTSILIVSHNIGVISYMADKIYVMYAGSVVEYGSTREIVRYSAHPYTQNLIQAVPKMNQPVFRAAGIAMRARESSGCPYVNHCPEKKKICEEQMPAFREILDGHYVRCWKSGEVL